MHFSRTYSQQISPYISLSKARSYCEPLAQSLSEGDCNCMMGFDQTSFIYGWDEFIHPWLGTWTKLWFCRQWRRGHGCWIGSQQNLPRDAIPTGIWERPLTRPLLCWLPQTLLICKAVTRPSGCSQASRVFEAAWLPVANGGRAAFLAVCLMLPASHSSNLCVGSCPGAHGSSSCISCLCVLFHGNLQPILQENSLNIHFHLPPPTSILEAGG